MQSITNIQIFKDGTFLFPLDGKYYPESDYLRTAIEDEKVRWLANCVTKYRHSKIVSWNRMWGKGRRGDAYRTAANFGDYEEEKTKVNNRAKRQMIRKCYPLFISLGVDATHFAELQNTDWETIAVANKFLEGKVEIPVYAEKSDKRLKRNKMESIFTDESFMPFGEHKGKKMANVPDDYLLWCYKTFTNWKYPAVKKYIEDNMDVLKSKVKK